MFEVGDEVHFLNNRNYVVKEVTPSEVVLVSVAFGDERRVPLYLVDATVPIGGEQVRLYEKVRRLDVREPRFPPERVKARR